MWKLYTERLRSCILSRADFEEFVSHVRFSLIPDRTNSCKNLIKHLTLLTTSMDKKRGFDLTATVQKQMDRSRRKPPKHHRRLRLPHHPTKHKHHPIFRQKLSFGQRAADIIATFGGSWYFIIIFSIFLIVWMIINAIFLLNDGFDPYPFILLNLVLSCLAAFQAPVILMAQNRQAERDRIDAKYDHLINRKAEREIQAIQKDLDSIRIMIRRMRRK